MPQITNTTAVADARIENFKKILAFVAIYKNMATLFKYMQKVSGNSVFA